MNKEQDKERIEEIDKIVNEGFNLSVKEILNCIEGKISDQERDKRLKLFNNDCLERIKKSLTFFKHSIRTEVGEEWMEKIKNVKYDYPKSENQKEHERNIDIIERTVNQIKNQLLQ